MIKRSPLLLITSILLNLTLGGFLVISYFHSRKVNETVTSKQSIAPEPPEAHVGSEVVKKRYRIAVIAPAICVPIDRIVEGLKEELSKNKSVAYHYTIYNGNGNRLFLRSQIEEALLKNFDLIMSIGQSCTLMLCEIANKKHESVPIVFTAVENPVKANIVKSEQHPGGNVTGSAAESISRHLEQLELLLTLKPNIKRVVIPYSSANDLAAEAELERLEGFLRRQNIPFKSVAIGAANEIIAKLSSSIESGDIIFTLRDATVMGAIAAIVKMACQYGASVFCSDLDAIEQGAVIAFGGRDADSGIGAAEKIREILENGKHPSTVPITIPKYRYAMLINKKMLGPQNFVIDPVKKFLIEHVHLID